MNGAIVCIVVGIICLAIGCMIGLSLFPKGFCLSEEDMRKLKNDTIVFYKVRNTDMPISLGVVACRDFKKVIIDNETMDIIYMDKCDVWYAQEVDECE